MILINPAQDTKFFQGSFIDVNQLWPYRDETIVINAASEHWGVDPGFILQMYDALESKHFDFWILSHHPGDHEIKPRIIFYPWYYYHSIRAFESIDIKKPRSRAIGCLHGNPRPHRIANYLALIDRFQQDKMHLSFFKTEFPANRADNVVLLEKEHDRWMQLKDTFPNRKISDYTIRIPALDDAYIHITSETTVIDHIFISEKTWKPIAAGQLFLHFGNPGTIGFLRTLGVDTFDDLIDHDSYDSISDWRQRMSIVHELADHLMTLDLENIWQATLSRRQSNVEKFFNRDFIQNYRHLVLDNALGNHVSSC
jgi:hypothetical protein